MILLPLLAVTALILEFGVEPGEAVPIQSLDEETYNWMENNPEWTPSGQKIIEGDIVLENDDPRPTSRKMHPDPERRWQDDPNTGWPTVIYTLQNFPAGGYHRIHDGFNHWMEHTCLRFQETTNLDQPHIDFIKGSGCYSVLGRSHDNYGQPLSLGRGCRKLPTVVHEIGHAIGFNHEQNRPDRDNYIKILYENIKPVYKFAFDKMELNTTVEYDFSSVMQYGSNYFSKNGLNTIIPRYDPTMERFLGPNTGLTFRDALLANIVYDCIGKWKKACGANSVECENSGYMGANCTCVCPPGTSGANCQNVEGDYYTPLTCGGNMTAPGHIKTSNWPDIFNTNEWCMWWVQAGLGERVRVTFHAFNLQYRRSNGRCLGDRLELRLQDPLTSGNIYCEDEMKPGDEFVSEGSEMFISFFGGDDKRYTGFSATIDFI